MPRNTPPTHATRDELFSVAADLAAELEAVKAELAKAKQRNERMAQYVDDACECARCCECQGWNPECSILATKRHKEIDIVTGEQLRAAAEGE